jgi:hypothetical protein
MKFVAGLFTVVSIALIGGCQRQQKLSEAVVAEGVVFSVEYDIGGGKTEGLARANFSGAVPGGNGSWNIDAYGKLTKDFLIITRPQHKDLGPHVIPINRVLSVQFGDGGILQVDEARPK